MSRNLLLALPARLRYTVGPRIGTALLFLTTYRARRRLARTGAVEILLDSCVLASAVTHETAWVSTGLQSWGAHQVDTGYAARVPIRSKTAGDSKTGSANDARAYQDACYLVGIAHLARLGLLKLRTAGELRIEQWQQPSGRFGGYSIFSHQLFDGIDITSVDGLPDTVFGPRNRGFPSLQEQQRDRLRRSTDALFRGIAKHLGAEKHSQDAWHIRTAEVSGMFCFLTTDYKLCNNVQSRRKLEPIKSLKTEVMTPTELGRHLGRVIK